jgi:hypothetical protein
MQTKKWNFKCPTRFELVEHLAAPKQTNARFGIFDQQNKKGRKKSGRNANNMELRNLRSAHSLVILQEQISELLKFCETLNFGLFGIFWIIKWKFLKRINIYRVSQKIMAKQVIYPLRHVFVLCFLTEWFFV